MIAAFLRAELLRALTFLPWLLGLHALSLGMQTVWSAEAIRLHEGLVNAALWLVTAGCAVASVWRDHPWRPHHPLADGHDRHGPPPTLAVQPPDVAVGEVRIDDLLVLQRALDAADEIPQAGRLLEPLRVGGLVHPVLQARSCLSVSEYVRPKNQRWY